MNTGNVSARLGSPLGSHTALMRCTAGNTAACCCAALHAVRAVACHPACAGPPPAPRQVSVVLETAVNEKGANVRSEAPLAIGR